jgi:hypothetical protein
MAALHAHRVAVLVGDDRDRAALSVDGIAELTQFLSTLLALQAATDIAREDRETLLPILNEWRRMYEGRLAGDASDRCYRQMTYDVSGPPSFFANPVN